MPIDIIQVAGWLLQSYILYTHCLGSWIMTSAVILYFTTIIRVAGLRLLPSYYTIHPLSGHLDYDFCSHIMLYTHYPVAGLRLLQSYDYRHYPGSWMTSAIIYIIHPLSGHLDYDFCSHIMLYTHYPGSWITTSAVILYYTPIIRVAGLRLLPSYTIHHYPDSWTMTSAVIWQYRDMIRVAGLRLLQSYDSIETLSV
jgi:hypothetical protein